MGTSFAASTKAVDAPDIEAAVYDAILARIDDKLVKGGQYQKDPKGDAKLAWGWKLLDDDGDPIREDRDGHENFGKPIVVDKLTGMGFNIAAKTTPAEVLILKAILTPAEFTDFEAGAPVEKEELIGRKAQVEVFVKDNGWPGVGNVIAARKPKKKAVAKAAEDEE